MGRDIKAKTAKYVGVTTDAAEVAVDILFVPVSGADDTLADLPWLDKAARGEVARARTSREFRSRLYDLLSLIHI